MLSNPATAPARGQHRIKMKGNMSLICWYNKGHFRFLTNAYSPVQQGGAPRGVGGAVGFVRLSSRVAPNPQPRLRPRDWQVPRLVRGRREWRVFDHLITQDSLKNLF